MQDYLSIKVMFKRIIDYSNKYFKLFDLIKNTSDARAKPQISSADISTSILSILFCNLGSLNRFNQSKDISMVSNISDRTPSAATIARSVDTIDADYLRKVLKAIYLKAKRSKMIDSYYEKYIGAVDGHEICSSDIHKCCHCSTRNISRAQRVVKLNYYHRYTAFVLAGPRFA